MTWAGRSQFRYEGSVENGTDIEFGNGWTVRVEADHYAALRQQFLNEVIHIGTSRTDAPQGSLGKWLQAHVNPRAISSYVGPILILEGYAEKVGEHHIRIIR